MLPFLVFTRGLVRPRQNVAEKIILPVEVVYPRGILGSGMKRSLAFFLGVYLAYESC